MKGFDLQSRVHRRYNPLKGEWVLVSPQRTARPWQGQAEPETGQPTARYDPKCYLCPGNRRAAGQVNPRYTSAFVFDNDFPALHPEEDAAAFEAGGLLRAEVEGGICRVVCYSPRHDLTLGQMPDVEIRGVVDTWAGEFRTLGAQPAIRAVTIFENRGLIMGASNPHPHGQIWANHQVPTELERESSAQRTHLAERARCLLCEYVALEIIRGERLIALNGHCIALVPFWATWPFEALVLPRGHVASIDDLLPIARDGFATILGELTRRYDALFDVPFPYTMGLHQRPTDDAGHPHWHLHAHFYPPLLRSATVRKFMVGYEMLAGPQRDLTPEDAAARLRQAGSV